ncbi:hypothetical protein KIW84_063722 [Lathyrus oleraceus]|uniref:PUM-HD domain-containing protein n=1 Tax=Pisum sativum TaxID=3888 RepID=A0A9D4W8D1_PEA|nr:hypothetical protein KIW84_063722 [Pisum sativum]
MNAMDSRGLGRGANLGPLLAASELRNASRLGNLTAGSPHQLPMFDPLYLQYLRSSEVTAAQIGALNESARNNNVPDLLSLQKAYIESLIAQQKAHFSSPYLGKSTSMNHNSYGNPSYGLGMSYPGNPLAGSSFPNSMYGQGSPMSQGERNARLSGMRNVAGGGLTGAWHSDAVSNLDDNFPPSLLDEFKSNKTKCFELSEISGHVVEFSADQYGSRFIQQKLETASVDEKTMVFHEIMPNALTLMTDVFGNYVIQKFFEHGSSEQIRELADQLTGHVLTLSLQMYGCRVIQKAIEVVHLDQQTKMVTELDGQIMRCHVLEHGKPEERSAIIKELTGQIVQMSQQKFASNVIEKCLCFGTAAERQAIVNEMIGSTDDNEPLQVCSTHHRCFFIPFNTGGHWLLLAINPIREIVYYLDSLGNDWTTYPDMKVLIDTVLQAFRAQRDIQTSRRGANSITWIKVACPQQRNQIDCGYFMLRFMRDTLALGRLKIPTDYFDEFKCAFYTKDQVDEIKEEWCQFMIKLDVCS